MEYDLPSLLNQIPLKLNTFTPKALRQMTKIYKIKTRKFKFKDVHISKLDLVDTPINLYKLSLNHGSLSAVDAYLGNDGKFSFKVADIRSNEGQLDEQPIKICKLTLE